MQCIYCQKEFEAKKLLICQYDNCKNGLCKRCIEEWHIKSYIKVLDPYGPKCKCDRHGFSIQYQEWYLGQTEKQAIWHPLLKSERKWFIKKLREKHNWDKNFTKSVLLEYNKFIKLKMILDDVDDKIFAPSPIIDTVWAHHLQYPTKYINYCHRVNKEKILYRSEELKDDESSTSYNERYSRTLSLLSEESFIKDNIWTHYGYIYRPDTQIFVRTITNKSISILVNLQEPVQLFKYRLIIKENITINLYYLSFGKTLEDNKSLSHYGIIKNSSIDLNVKFN